MEHTIESLEYALRQAVAAGEFETVPDLAQSYAAVVESKARRLDAREPQFSLLEGHALAVLAWARENALAHHSRAAARLRETLAARHYEQRHRNAHTTDTFA